jgi:hypothetical protein
MGRKTQRKIKELEQLAVLCQTNEKHAVSAAEKLNKEVEKLRTEKKNLEQIVNQINK